MDDQLEKKIEDNIEDLPREVSDFIFGDQMEKVMTEIGGLLENNPDQKEHIQNDITFFLLGVYPFEDMVSYIDSLNVEVQTIDSIKTIIQEKILDELQLLMEVHQEIETGETAQLNNAPSPAELLARLNQNIIKPTVLAPAKRDRIDPLSAEPTAAPVKPEGFIDPYRELPEK